MFCFKDYSIYVQNTERGLADQRTNIQNKLILKYNNEIEGEIPIDALASKAPVYDRKWVKKKLSKSKIKLKASAEVPCTTRVERPQHASQWQHLVSVGH